MDRSAAWQRGPAVTVFIQTPVRPADVRALCRRVDRLLASHPGARLECELAPGVGADPATVDALARLQVTARRSGGQMRVRRCSTELRALIRLVGLGGQLL